MQIKDPKVERGITMTFECSKVCFETMHFCLTQGGPYAQAGHIMHLADCAKMCSLSADFMARGSVAHGKVCALCADICIACAESCEELEGEEMKHCADTCRTCADVCRTMAA